MQSSTWVSSSLNRRLYNNMELRNVITWIELLCKMVLMRNLMNQIANMGSQDTLHQFWNSSLKAMNHPHDSSAGVGYHTGSDGLSSIENLLMLLDNSSPPTWFLLLYKWCHLCQAKYESHVELGKRIPQMVGTGLIRLAKLILMPDDGCTWQSKNCSLDRLPYRPLCVISGLMMDFY
ncbi:hypothetical protein ACLB2K_067474 [Fragaria x ananassa]